MLNIQLLLFVNAEWSFSLYANSLQLTDYPIERDGEKCTPMALGAGKLIYNHVIITIMENSNFEPVLFQYQ